MGLCPPRRSVWAFLRSIPQACWPESGLYTLLFHEPSGAGLETGSSPRCPSWVWLLEKAQLRRPPGPSCTRHMLSYKVSGAVRCAPAPTTALGDRYLWTCLRTSSTELSVPREGLGSGCPFIPGPGSVGIHRHLPHRRVTGWTRAAGGGGRMFSPRRIRRRAPPRRKRWRRDAGERGRGEPETLEQTQCAWGCVSTSGLLPLLSFHFISHFHFLPQADLRS